MAPTQQTELDNRRVNWIEKLGLVRFRPKGCLIEKQNLVVLDSDFYRRGISIGKERAREPRPYDWTRSRDFYWISVAFLVQSVDRRPLA